MNNEFSYWSPICGLVSNLRCWVRVCATVGGDTHEGHWGQLLIIPTDGYLEGPGGPLPFREIKWIEISMSRIKGGIAGYPLQFINAKDDILTRLRAMQVEWELHGATWSKEGIFEDEPVEVVRIANLFGASSRP